MNPSFGERAVVVTGAGGLLGRRIIAMLATRLPVIGLTSGKNPAANGPRDAESVSHLACDLEDEREIEAVVEQITRRFEVAYLINSAADVAFHGGASDIAYTLPQVTRQFAVNVFAPCLLASHLFHKQWKGAPVQGRDVSILNISSISAVELYPKQGQDFYAASKAALNRLTLYMAAEYGAYGIRVNALMPGRFSTEADADSVARAALSILLSDCHGKVVKHST